MEKFVKTISDLWKIESYFLSDWLFTESEIKEFETRLEIFKMTAEWATQREISSKLWISITTVSRWSATFKNKPKLKELI